MAKEKYPITPAIRFLKEHRIAFVPHEYEYKQKGTKGSSHALGIAEHQIIKTLVMEDEQKAPLIVLMHGDKEVSTKNLARILGKKSISPVTPENLAKHTGYQPGGTSPFGTRKKLSVYVEKSILELPKIWINGGKRGFLVEIAPRELVRTLGAVAVEVGI